MRIVDWGGAAAAGAALCGGKGWNLGRLHRYGFPVPAGGVLTAGAYIDILAQPSLASLVQEADQDLVAIRAAVEAAPLPPGIEEDLARFLTAAGLADLPVAVRSSATAEDGAEHSFAGIHQSFLNVRGLPAIVAAVKRCYASLWTPQAVAYRRRVGLSDDAVACAVVICAMVTRPGAGAPESAGVAFACDPRTGRRDLITISAAPGLGEAVVSGAVNPEEISVKRENGTFSLHSRGGRPDQVLTDEQALALARLTERVHWALGDGQAPQDIEWVHDGQRFWLLQARPVTRLPLVTFPGAEGLPVIWSNANLKDAVAGVQSTMSWSLLKQMVSYLLYSPLPMAGYAVPPGIQSVRRIEGRAYFDLTGMQWAMNDAIGMPPAELVRTLGGHQPLIPVPEATPAEKRRRDLARLRFTMALRRQMKGLPSKIAAFHQASRVMREQDPASMSAAQLLDRAAQRWALNRDFGPRFQAANMNAGVWPSVLTGLLARYVPDRAQAIVSALLAGSGMVTSAEHGYRLYDLAAAARTDPEGTAYLTRRPLNPQGWRALPGHSPFRQELERFLAEFGHRAVYEAEVANPRWRDDPTFLLEQVRNLLESGTNRSPRAQAEAVRAAGEQELAQLPWYIRPVARWLVTKSQEGAALREAAKSAIAAVAEPGRRDILEVGRRMVAAGHLDHSEEIFHLSAMDWELYLRGEWDGAGARALVADRRSRDEDWLAGQEPQDFYIVDADGRPAMMPGTAPVTAAAAAPTFVRGGGAVLNGVGVSAGRATGVARVIRHPHEGHRLQDGDVLVAPSTDPGWTPLFLRASAVVTEVGGYLSHGAIVAREYGLPGVVNIPGLLRLVEDGQILTVDGDSGTVTLGEILQLAVASPAE